jgi:hypothetical protein
LIPRQEGSEGDTGLEIGEVIPEENEEEDEQE